MKITIKMLKDICASNKRFNRFLEQLPDGTTIQNLVDKLIEKIIIEEDNIYKEYMAISLSSNVDVTRACLKAGAKAKVFNSYALILSALYGHLAVVELLLEAGANVHASDDLALQWAAKNGHEKVVKLLLKNGANVHADDDYPLRISAENGHEKIVELLEKHIKKEN